MTPPDYHALFSSRDPDGHRAALLASLAAGLPLPRALSGAFGKSLPLALWKAVGEMRQRGGERYDEELAAACEGAEQRKKEAEHDGAEQGQEEDSSDFGGRLSAIAGADSDGAPRTPVPAAPGADDRHLSPRGRGREEAPETEEGGAAGYAHGDGAGLLADAARDRNGPEARDGDLADRGGTAGLHQSSGDGKDDRASSSGRLRGGDPGGGGAERGGHRGSGVALPSGFLAAIEAVGEREPAVAEWSPPVPSLFDRLLELDAKRAARGHPRLSPWWRWSFGDFLASRKPWGIYLVGRGGGKSTSLELLAASLARYGVRRVPPGQVWTMPFISVGPDDANRRITGIAACFRADGLAIVGDLDDGGGKVKPGDGVKIARAPRGSLELLDAAGNEIQLASIAGTIGNVSGPSTFGLVIDEAAKLMDKATGANPLTEIIASGAQTSRGRAGWLALICSSAWEPSGAHYGLVTAPPNEVNYVARIGADFIDTALAGFEDVAAWEQRRGDLVAARRIREHAASLRADSPLVPSWVPNPTIGNPSGPEAWEGAALATRMLVQVLPDAALEGVPRIDYWLRENGSVPLDRGESGANAAAQCLMAASITRRVNEARHGRVVPAQPELMPVAGVDPGDPRYAWPPPRAGGYTGGGLARRKVF